MTPTENDSGWKDSTYPRCQKCSGRFVPTSFEQAYCLECSHELLGEDMEKAEQPPAWEAKYSFRREHGKLYVVQPNGYFLCECCHESDAQQIIDALNFISGAESELKPEGSLVKVLKELLTYRCSSNQDDENFKRVEEFESRLADLILERNEKQKTIANYSQWLADATKELARAKEKAAWVDDFATLIDSDFFYAPVPLKYAVDRAKAELRAILKKTQAKTNTPPSA